MRASSDRLHAVYWLETPTSVEAAAAAIAGEQSTGTFVRLAGETDAVRRAQGARVERITELEGASEPSLPHARPSKTGTWQRAEIEISWPIANFGTSLPNVLATVAGNLYELGEVTGLRLRDLVFPSAFAEACPGPAFAVAGTRRLAGVESGPIVGTIIKPSVGLDPGGTAALVSKLIEAGIDFVKDDELQADGPACPFEQRVGAVMHVVNAYADRTGRKPMIAFNITGEIDEMRRRHDTVLAAGGTCVMVSIHSVGLAGFLALRRHSALPIHAHRNGWGYLSRCPALGFDYVAWQKLWRLAGADHMHVNGLRNKFSEPDDCVIASARACLTPMVNPPAPGFEVMPVFSSGQWAGQAPETFARLGSDDIIYACGGGIMAHPGGVAAGVVSIREAFAAAREGVELARYAETHPSLRQALAAFGK